MYIDTLYQYAIIILIYALIRYAAFDYTLNIIRGKDINYKTGHPVLKVLALFVIMGLIYYFYTLN